MERIEDSLIVLEWKIGPEIRIRIDKSFHSSSELVFIGLRTGSGGPSLWFSFVGGFISSEELKDNFYVYSLRNQEPGRRPKAALLFLDCSSLVSASPSSPD